MLAKNDPDIIGSYLEDSSNLKGGYAEEVIFPENVEELAEFLKRANSNNIPVTVSGGGTGTTGSRVPFGGAVVSMEKFNKILSFSESGMSFAVQTGVLVERLKEEAEAKGLFYASHPTEKTASVGGTIATNASGSRSFKYGPTRKYVKRLKMVLADGEVLEVRRGEWVLSRRNSKIRLAGGREIEIPIPEYRMPCVKNAAGYFIAESTDPIDLFIGQEGTLSIIVEADVGLAKKPSSIFSCFVFFEREKDAWNFSGEARELSRNKKAGRKPGIDALSIEYFDSNALGLLKEKGVVIPDGAKAAIFFEQESAGREEDALAEEWMRLITKHDASLDKTWVAMNENRLNAFTAIRHAVPEAVNDIIRRDGFQKLSTDIAVPDSNFEEMMNFYMDSFKGARALRHVIFGHIGESHVHVNILPRSGIELDAAKKLCMSFARKGVSLGGTVSAEHGIGKIKHKYLELMYGGHGIVEMARIKKALDPNCILGLDNIFPREILKSI